MAGRYIVYCDLSNQIILSIWEDFRMVSTTITILTLCKQNDSIQEDHSFHPNVSTALRLPLHTSRAIPEVCHY